MRNLIDITGNRYGRYTVLKRDTSVKRGHAFWLCKCDCGNIKSVDGQALKSGHTQSCGCLLNETRKKVNTKHGESYTRIHKEWTSMISRCTYKGDTSYPRYGGRGITICEEWRNDYLVFRDWAYANGYRDNLTLDRIDVNGNYEPSNCRWITYAEQNINRRNTIRIEYNGETKPLLVWCQELGLNYRLMHQRIRRLHWSANKAFNTPVGGGYER